MEKLELGSELEIQLESGTDKRIKRKNKGTFSKGLGDENFSTDDKFDDMSLRRLLRL